MSTDGMPCASRSDVGRRREHNEDALLVRPPVLAVADGVGGSAKGEVASRTALDSFEQHAAAVLRAATGAEAVRAMESAVLAANAAVHAAQLRDESLRGMATTITAAAVRDGGEVVVGHVGDSRLYVLSAAGARQATSDHSVVAELVRSGRLDPAEASHHPQRNVITRALGTEPDVSVDAFVVHVGPGDWLLACSDGLTEHVADAELGRIVIEHGGEPEAAVARLVTLANDRGGTDNITVIIAQPVPSDVSGELSLEALQASTDATTQMAATRPSDAPAEASGPMPAIGTRASGAAAGTAVLPALEPIERGGGDGAGTRRAPRRHRSRGTGWLLAALMALVAAGAIALVWSQSYFLLERPDGRVGIDRGFPVAGLSTPYETSSVAAEELDPADRQRLVDSHRILSRGDAERVLAELPQRIDDPIDDQEEPDGVAART